MASTTQKIENFFKEINQQATKKQIHPYCLGTERLSNEFIKQEEFQLFNAFYQTVKHSITSNTINDENLKIVNKEKLKAVSSAYGEIKQILISWPRNAGGTKCESPYELMIRSLIRSLGKTNENLEVIIVTFDEAYVSSSIDAEKKLTSTKAKGHKIKNVKKRFWAKLKKELLGKLSKLKQEELGAILELSKSQGGPSSYSINFNSNKVKKYLELIIKGISLTDFTIWIQDPFLILNSQRKGNDKVYFLEPGDIYFYQGADVHIANRLKAKDNKRFDLIEQVPFRFHGGNVLIGEDYALMGAGWVHDEDDYIKKAKAYLGIEEVHVLRSDNSNQSRLNDILKSLPNGYFEAFQSLMPNWVKKNQPLYHLDLFITIAGKSANKKNLVVVGQAVSTHPEARYAVDLLNHRIQQVVDQLYSVGFDVIRNPMPITYLEYLEDQKWKKEWYLGLYNNCLVEIINSNEKIVYLPKYGYDYSPGFGNWSYLEPFDTINQNIWETLGFKVVLLGDFHPFSVRKGGPHCMMKCLKRD